MQIQELKNQIENKKVNLSSGLIFTGKDSDFLKQQYIDEIAKSMSIDVFYLDSLDDYSLTGADLLLDITDTTSVRVIKLESLKGVQLSLSDCSNLIILVKCKLEDVSVDLQPYCVDFPKLDDWQIKDFIYSLGEGVKPVKLDWLFDNCKDLNRLLLELKKLNIFLPADRDMLFDMFMAAGDYNDFSNISNFDLSNAVITKDIDKIKYYIDDGVIKLVDPFALLGLLINSFRNMIRVKCAKFPTPENTGLNSKQLYVIGKQCKLYGAEQLISIFRSLVKLDIAVKSGKITANELIDNILVEVIR